MMALLAVLVNLQLGSACLGCYLPVLMLGKAVLPAKG